MILKIFSSIFCLLLASIFPLMVVDVPVQKMSTQFAADFSNDRILVGASHNIFVGRVIEQIGSKERGMGPETQFSVEVVDNIKGNLKGSGEVRE